MVSSWSVLLMMPRWEWYVTVSSKLQCRNKQFLLREDAGVPTKTWEKIHCTLARHRISPPIGECEEKKGEMDCRGSTPKRQSFASASQFPPSRRTNKSRSK